MIYEEVFRELNKSRVKYVVVGGVAVVMHGFRRLTDDLDLIVLLEEKNLDKLFEALNKAGYSPKVPVTKDQFKDKQTRESWKKDKGMIVFSFYERNPPFKLIDMFVDEPIKFDTIYKNRIRAQSEGVSVPLISIDHLKKLKKLAGRDRDMRDIEKLNEIQRLEKKRVNAKKNKK